MRTPSDIATVAFISVFVSTLVAHAVSTRSGSFTESIIAAGGIGAFVWAGTYIGARWAPRQQRTVRLAQVLGVLYGIVVVALSMPIKTHAIRVDMPPPGEGRSPFTTLVLAAVAIAVPLAVLATPILVARGMAILCAGRVVRDA